MNTVICIGLLVCISVAYASALPAAFESGVEEVPVAAGAAAETLEGQETVHGWGGRGWGGRGWGGRGWGGGWGGRGGWGYGGYGGGWGGYYGGGWRGGWGK